MILLVTMMEALHFHIVASLVRIGIAAIHPNSHKLMEKFPIECWCMCSERVWFGPKFILFPLMPIICFFSECFWSVSEPRVITVCFRFTNYTDSIQEIILCGSLIASRMRSRK